MSGHAIVRYGSSSFRLRPADELTFGRGADRDIRIGHDPRDDLVSRAAGVIVGLEDGALVRNLSQTQSFRVVAMPGPAFVVRPGMALGTMPHLRIRLEVSGRYGQVYPVLLDLRGLVRSAATAGGSRPPGAPTASDPDRLSPRELRMLAALCEPMLLLAGREPATYREIAERLGGTATAQSVRTGLDRLRNRLADVDGIPGLRGDDDDPARGDAAHFVAALARWAIDTGQIGAEHIRLLLPARK